MRYSGVIVFSLILAIFTSCSSQPNNNSKNQNGQNNQNNPGGQNNPVSGAGIKGGVKVLGVDQNVSLMLKSPSRNRVNPLFQSHPAGKYRDIPNTLTEATNSLYYDFSGPADYIKMTLLKIVFQGASGTYYSGWSGSQQLYVDGSGYATNTSNIILSIPTNEVIVGLQATFSTDGAMQGTLTGPFGFPGSMPPYISNIDGTANGPTNTFYTKSAFPNFSVSTSNTTTGGAPDFTSFETGPAEEVYMCFQGRMHDPDGQIVLSFPVVTNQGIQSNLTIVMDIDRALRFNDGQPSQGVTNRAGFYTLNAESFIMASFGVPGLIQGYRTEYKGTAPNTFNGESGWLELIFDANTNFLCGSSMADQDANYCVCAGDVTNFTGSSFSYSLGSSVWTINNFLPQTATNTGICLCNWTNLSGMQLEGGQAAFQLIFQAN